MTTTWFVDTLTAVMGEHPEPDETGCEWMVTTEDGWWSTPQPSIVTDRRSREDGAYDAQTFLGGREIELSGTVVSPDTDRLEHCMQALAATMVDGSRLYDVVRSSPAGDKLVRARRADVVQIMPTSPVSADWVLPLWSPDPRKYDANEFSDSTGLPAGINGLSIPAAVPLAIAANGASGRVDSMNNGTADTFPIVEITGPVTNPSITIENTGMVLAFDLTLTVSDILTIDPGAGQIVINGSASRESALQARSSLLAHFTLPPGSSSITYRATASPGGSLMTVRVRSAWV